MGQLLVAPGGRLYPANQFTCACGDSTDHLTGRTDGLPDVAPAETARRARGGAE